MIYAVDPKDAMRIKAELFNADIPSVVSPISAVSVPLKGDIFVTADRSTLNTLRLICESSDAGTALMYTDSFAVAALLSETRLNFDCEGVTVFDREIYLTKAERLILRALTLDAVVSRKSLAECAMVTEASVAVHVSDINGKFTRALRMKAIEAVYRRGYRLAERFLGCTDEE